MRRGVVAPEVTLLTSALTVLLCLLGVAGMLGGTAVRVSADLAGLVVLAVYSARRDCSRGPVFAVPTALPAGLAGRKL